MPASKRVDLHGDLPEPIQNRMGGRKRTTRPVGKAPLTPTGRASGHRKDGTFRKFQVKPKKCSVSRCTTAALALGFCRKHYERNRKYGNPLTLGKAGGPKRIPAVLNDAGITTRQRNHWIEHGHIQGERDQHSGRFMWSTDATRCALLIHLLLGLDLPLPMAARAAREVVKNGAQSVPLGAGVELRVSDPTMGVSAL